MLWSPVWASFLESLYTHNSTAIGHVPTATNQNPHQPAPFLDRDAQTLVLEVRLLLELHGAPCQLPGCHVMYCNLQGLLFWLLKGGFQSSSGTTQCYRSSYSTHFDNSEIAGLNTENSQETIMQEPLEGGVLIMGSPFMCPLFGVFELAPLLRHEPAARVGKQARPVACGERDVLHLNKTLFSPGAPNITTCVCAYIYTYKQIDKHP